MSVKIEHVGWCKQGNHDKVWGVIRLSDSNCITFWGRRGAKLQTKMITASHWTAEDLFRKKLDKGYRRIAEHELARVYPEFQQDLEKTAVWAILSV